MFLDKLEKRGATHNGLDWSEVFATGGSAPGESELRESTYFKCIKIIAESVAKLPINLMKSTEEGEVKAKYHYLYNLLRNRPNEYMSAIDFFTAMEATRQHKGDSFALIIRDNKGLVLGLYPIDVTRLIVDNTGLCKSNKKNKILVEYQVEGKAHNCFYSDVLHFKGFTLDGIHSLSVKDNLENLITTNESSQKYQLDLFSNGLTNKAVVQMVSDIKDEKELKKVQDKFGRLYSSKGRILTVPAGYTITPLNLSLADSQFEQLKKLNAIDLATAFGVPPYMLGFTENYNNNSLEQTNLSFLVDTLLIKLESIEQELNYKLLSGEVEKDLYFEFNQGVLLRVDQKTQAEILRGYVASGIYSSNEARLLLGKTKAQDGDDLIVNAGVLKLKDISNKSLKGGENDGEGNKIT